MFSSDVRLAVVVPTYKSSTHILNVINSIGPEVDLIYVVDDACPESTGAFVKNSLNDDRVRVITHEINQGVGGAVLTGYQAAIAEGATVIIKIDSDGQMDPALISQFVQPIISGEADYTKGNRFYDIESVRSMPKMRLFGNAVLSFMTKASSGYWDLFDPTNGYTAISSDVAKLLPFEKISKRYFFETDMLFRLNTLRAVAVDVPMEAKYGDEVSNLKVSKIVGEFFVKHCRNFLKRVFYNYYLRDMSVASIELPLGLLLLLWGLLFGGAHWYEAIQTEHATPVGTVVLAALGILMGAQLLLAFISFDVMRVPNRPRTRNGVIRNQQSSIPCR